MFWKKKPDLPEDVKEAVVAAIQQSEKLTTGEIRVFIERHCDYMDAMDRAIEVFRGLGMEQTEERNAVLVYIAMEDKQFAIFGDEEIHRKAGGAAFWKKAAHVLQEGFRNGELAKGLIGCIGELGTALVKHFPCHPGVEKNQLPDEIVFGK